MILVTGAAGFLGSHLLLELMRNKNLKIRALYFNNNELDTARLIFSFYTADTESAMGSIEWVKGNLLYPAEIEPLLKNVTDIYHCAATVSFNNNDHDLIISTNTEITANIVNLSLEYNIRKFCHVSSTFTLENDGGMLTEDSYWTSHIGKSAYSISKYLSEMEVWRGIAEGLEAVIVNPSIILGAGDWNSGNPGMFKAVNSGLNFYPPGVCGFVDVRDVAAAMSLLMSDAHFAGCKGGRYVLNSENRSFRELLNMIADALHKPRPKHVASEFALRIGARLLKNTFGGAEFIANLTAETRYDGSKLTAATGFTCRPLIDTVNDIAKIFER
ncbi:MAG: SDR family oxidoreductase [Bacteroidales bacterium]|jgi:nucleoside-diphosphate-sugar epimerase|nr:SDR family oxidoreductase [Bacteroidales bacterium]